MTSSDRPTGQAADLPGDPAAMETRKAFLDLCEADIARLRALHDRLDRRGEYFVDDFYAHLMRFAETRALIPDEATLARLKRTQLEYFGSLTAGEYGEAYVRHRLRVGLVHERIGLRPEWYIGAYARYLNLLTSQVTSLYADRPGELLPTLQAIHKIVLFDVGLAIDAYIETREAAVRRQAEQLAVLNRLAVTMTASLAEDEVNRRVLEGGMFLANAEAAALVGYHDGNRQFSIIDTRGLGPAFLAQASFRTGGLADRALGSGSPIISDDTPGTPYPLSHLMHQEGIRSFISLPLRTQREKLGVLYLYRRHATHFAATDIDLLKTFAQLASGAIDNAHRHAETADLAARDALTGLANRRSLMETLESEFRRASRYGKPFCVMMMDIDHFKSINDRYGHPGGDDVLRQIAHVLQARLRGADLLGRYGGEEFFLIAPEMTGEVARKLAERLREGVARQQFRLADGKELNVTVSIGIAAYPESAPSPTLLIARADEALYEAKRDGRNRCIFADGKRDNG